ncbi:hypothetical protein ACFOU2_05385 [Bacillus songklensis]|uniref:Uncharacterized protein n=1 Tax=Bacillus songklensis TaxID=1069116 RepID=A0ABV8AYD5_9BACI
MNIIDFLMSNFFIFIVIAGFLINLLKKYSEEMKESKKQRELVQRKPAVDVRNEVEEARRFQKQASAVISKIETVKETKRSDPASSATQKTSLPIQSNVNRKGRRVNSLPISKKQMVQGIIWSEILAPPKAKRK